MALSGWRLRTQNIHLRQCCYHALEAPASFGVHWTATKMQEMKRNLDLEEGSTQFEFDDQSHFMVGKSPKLLRIIGKGIEDILLSPSMWLMYKGASIYYVFKIFGILDPLPPCSLFGLNHKTKFTQPRLLRSLLGTLPPPPLCERNKWIAPNRTNLDPCICLPLG